MILGLSFFAQCWWPRESMLWGSRMLSEFRTSLSKVLTLWHCVKVKQCYRYVLKVLQKLYKVYQKSSVYAIEKKISLSLCCRFNCYLLHYFFYFQTHCGYCWYGMFLLHPNRPPTLRLEELPGGWDAHVICRIYCGPIIPHLFFWRGASWKWLFITQHK